MILDQYLLLLFSRQPRRMKVIANTIANRKTQATLFWANSYGILNWLGADRSLHQEEFDHWLAQQVSEGLMAADDQTAWLTSLGAARQAELRRHAYHPQFDQWTWLVNPQIYAERFLLAVQAVSHWLHHDRHYVPLNLNTDEIQTVHRWVAQPGLAERAARGVYQLASRLDQVNSRLAALFANQLFGYQLTGWSSHQAAAYFGVADETIFLMDRDIWLALAHWLQSTSSVWGPLMNPLLATLPISHSAAQTLNDFNHGLTIHQIAQQRHLKLSTIREHLLEAAIIIPDYVDWDRLLPADGRSQLSLRYQGDPMQWHFLPSGQQDQAQEFFAFRLYQIYRSRQANE